MIACDAILLARGGSKGLPGKNIIDLAGKPLIAWTIEAARKADCVRDVVVSTDSPEIAEVARAHGAVVPALRPAELAGDLSSSESALLHALEHMCRKPATEAFLFPQVTSPLRADGLFDSAIAAFEDGGYDSMFSSTLVRNFLWRGRHDPQPQYDPLNRPMRQQLTDEELFFRENGNFYICRTDGFLAARCRLFGRIGMFETSEDEALEIDTRDDLEEIAAALTARGG
ncbi:MAG: acylneuraminate cytidylyltransferase family protein [Rhizobiaceae bacterium]|nr:acylneuraminate cytidylyltransferase family protein [Rhizobiaceae bacterium]